MAPLNSNQEVVGKPSFQRWIIEDSWDGTIYLEARLYLSWQGCCGSYKLLVGPDGRHYFWAVLPGSDGRGALQRLVSFQDQETMAAALDLPTWHDWTGQAAFSRLH